MRAARDLAARDWARVCREATTDFSSVYLFTSRILTIQACVTETPFSFITLPKAIFTIPGHFPKSWVCPSKNYRTHPPPKKHRGAPTPTVAPRSLRASLSACAAYPQYASVPPVCILAPLLLQSPKAHAAVHVKRLLCRPSHEPFECVTSSWNQLRG